MATLTWTNTSGGNWNTASNWSGDIVPTATDDVVINGLGTFAVTVGSTQQVGSVTLDGPNASLDLESGTLQPTGTILVTEGTLDIENGLTMGFPNGINGEVLGGTIEATGGVIDAAGATLSGVTFLGSNTIAAQFMGDGVPPSKIMDGLTLEGSSGSGPGTLTVSDVSFSGAQVISGGTVVLTDYEYVTPIVGIISTDSAVTIASDTTILAVNEGELSGTFVSHGVIQVADGASLDLNGSTIENDGTILVSPGGALTMDAAITSLGSIESAGGTLVFKGTVTTPGVTGFGAGTSIEIGNSGTLDNTGSVLTLGSNAIPNLVLRDAAILGGTLDFQPGGTLSGIGEYDYGTLTSAAGTLVGVALAGAGTLDLATPSEFGDQPGLLYIENGLSLEGAGGTGPGSLAVTDGDLDFYGNQSVTGGTLDFANSLTAAASITGDSGTLTVGADAVVNVTGLTTEIDGNVVNDGIIDIAAGANLELASGGTLENDGTIVVERGAAFAQNGSIFGTGTVDYVGGTTQATIIVDSSVTTASLTGIGPGTTLDIEAGGTVINTGAVLNLGSGAIASLILDGTIIGGTLDFATGAALSAQYPAALSGVTMEGSETLALGSGYIYIYNGLSLQGSGGTGPGALALSSGDLYFNGNEPISNGTIDLGGGSNNYALISASYGTLTIAADAAVSVTGTDDSISGDVDNDGLVAVGSGAELYFNSDGNFVNRGTLDVASGSTLWLEGGFANYGTVTGAGAALVEVEDTATLSAIAPMLSAGANLVIASNGTLINDGTLTLGSASVGTLTLDGGTIVGGVLGFQPSGTLSVDGPPAASLIGVTLQGSETLGFGYVLDIGDSLSLQGSGGSGAGDLVLTQGTLNFSGGATIAGGTIDLASSELYFGQNSDISIQSGTLTIAANAAVDVTAGEGDSITGNVINDGLVTVALGAALTVGAGGTFDNAGDLTVASGGTLLLAGGFENTGSATIDGVVEATGSVSLAELQEYGAALHAPISMAGTLDLAGGTLDVGAGTDVGTLVVGSDGVIEGGTIVDSGGGLVINGGTLNNIAYQGTLSADDVTFAGSATFSGIGGGRGDIAVTNGVVVFQNGQTIDNVNIQLDSQFTNIQDYETSGTYGFATLGTLTLGSNTSITAGHSVTVDAFLVSAGTITDTQPGYLQVLGLANSGSLTVSGGGFVQVGALQNSGSISVSDRAVLYVGGTLYGPEGFPVSTSLSNAGHITETDSTIVLNTDIGLNSLTGITRSGGLIKLDGALALGGGTLNVGGGTALGQLQDNGVISGGTIHDTGGGVTFVGTQPSGTDGGTLIATTYEGTLNLIPAFSTLGVSGGLSVTGANGNGAGVINLLGSSSYLNFWGSQTLDNVTINVGDDFDATNLRVLSHTEAAAVLTLGPHATMAQWGARAAIDIGWSYGDSLVNNGVIGAVATNGEMLIAGGTLLNNGSVIVANGETLNLQVQDFANLSGSTLNGGSWTVYDGSTLDLGYDNPIATLNAALYLGGPGAVVQSLNSATGLETTLNQSLQTIGGGGELVLANGASFDQAGVLRDLGRIVLAGGTLGAEPLAIFPNANVIGFGTLVGTTYDSGIVMAQGGNLALDGAFYPGGQTGAAWINVGATLTASSALAVPVRFIGSTGELVLEQASATVGTISGFTGNDVIDLRNVSATGVSLNFSGGVLTVKTGTTTDATLHFAGNYVTANFSAASDGHGGTLIKDPPVSLHTAALTLADFGGTGSSGPSGGGGSGAGGGTIAASSVTGMVAAPTDTTHGGAVAMLNIGH